MAHTILVSAAALRTSGARTIYRQFLQHLKTRVDGNQYYVMVDACMERPLIDGVNYWVIDVSCKWKRIQFEWKGFRKLLKEYKVYPDLVVSLQNLGIWQLRQIPHIIYYHNSLPFFSYKWNPLKRSEMMMFFYKHVYPHIVSRTLGDQVDMVVQLPSIKEGVERCYGLNEKQVHVMFPDLEQINIETIAPYAFKNEEYHFVFPATSAPYKGHLFLVDMMAYIRQKDRGVSDCIKIHLTLVAEKEQNLIRLMQKKGVRDNFVFHGVVPHDTLLSMYKSSMGLLFPSVIETLGLPLIECACFGKAILACDLRYAHEVLSDYEGAKFLPCRQTEQWGDTLLDTIREQDVFNPMLQSEQSAWDNFFDLIAESIR